MSLLRNPHGEDEGALPSAVIDLVMAERSAEDTERITRIWLDDPARRPELLAVIALRQPLP